MRGRSRGWRGGAWAERAERAEGAGMHWGLLKSAEKPHASEGWGGRRWGWSVGVG